MSAFNKFNIFVNDLASKVHNLGSDTLKVVLSNTVPVATNTVLGNITQIANGNGYTTGGSTAALVSLANASGLTTLKLSNVVFTATGAMGPFEYAVLYNSTASGLNLIGWWDYGSAVTLASGETFTVQFDATNGVLTLQ